MLLPEHHLGMATLKLLLLSQILLRAEQPLALPSRDKLYCTGREATRWNLTLLQVDFLFGLNVTVTCFKFLCVTRMSTILCLDRLR